jgi:hypothetical protein
MDKTIVTGQWCEVCEMFEGDPEMHEDGACYGCGCPNKEHITVKVVMV